MQSEVATMNYDKIILEMLDRIKTLENKVAVLEKEKTDISDNDEVRALQYDIEVKQAEIKDIQYKVSLTQRIKDYIDEQKIEAKKKGLQYLDLNCGDIQKYFHISNRPALVCNAMYGKMTSDDQIIQAPPSKMSTTVVVRYDLSKVSLEQPKNTIYIERLKRDFKEWFYKTKPEYKYPGPLFGMAFYVIKHEDELGISLQDLVSGKVSLDEYTDILKNQFIKLGSTNVSGRTNAYRDAMKNFLTYIEEAGLKSYTITF